MARLANLDQMTLRDKIREASRRSHELAEHLQQAFVPKVHGLRKVTRPQKADSATPPIADVTIRHQAALVLESDHYTEGLCEQAEALFEAISTEIDKLAAQGMPR